MWPCRPRNKPVRIPTLKVVFSLNFRCYVSMSEMLQKCYTPFTPSLSRPTPCATVVPAQAGTISTGTISIRWQRSPCSGRNCHVATPPGITGSAKVSTGKKRRSTASRNQPLFPGRGVGVRAVLPVAQGVPTRLAVPGAVARQTRKNGDRRWPQPPIPAVRRGRISKGYRLAGSRRFGVGLDAVLGDVQAFHLLGLADAHAHGELQQVEQGETGHQRPSDYYEDADNLRQ